MRARKVAIVIVVPLALIVLGQIASAATFGWTDPLPLTGTTPAKNADGIVGAGPKIASVGSELIAVWTDYSRFDRYTNPDTEIVARTSTDKGDSWTPALNLSHFRGQDEFPIIAASPTSAVVAWTQGPYSSSHVELARFDGQSWARSQLSGEARAIDVIFSGTTYYLLTAERLLQSTDDGQNWSAVGSPRTSMDWPGQHVIAADGEMVTAVWTASASGQWDLQAQHSSDGGHTWEEPQQLTDSFVYEAFPTIASKGSLVTVAWLERTGEDTCDLKVAYSVDSGVGWSSPIKLRSLNSRTDGVGVTLLPSSVGVELYLTVMGKEVRRFISSDGAAWTAAGAVSIPGVGRADVAPVGEGRHLVADRSRRNPEYAVYPVYAKGAPGIQQPTVARVEATPNPFFPNGDGVQEKTKIRFTLAASGIVDVTVRRLTGKPVRDLVKRRKLSAGTHSFQWDGRSDAGRLLASGRYRVTITASNRYGKEVGAVTVRLKR